MDELQLLATLHQPQERQGPGGDDESRLAISLAGLDQTTPLDVLDIGCGTGASSLLLARELNATVTAVDFLSPFLRELDQRATSAGLSNSITTVEASMDALPFPDGSYDVIWSEGAIYNLGFENGLKSIKDFVKPGGYVAVSEAIWLKNNPPAPVEKVWEAYP